MRRRGPARADRAPGSCALEGGTLAWLAAGLPARWKAVKGEAHLAAPRTDRYRRPHEGTDNAAAAMQAYLDWVWS
ncbi:hypothetical protein ACTMU2_25695 [Cupriavidus basilensis]